MPPDAATPGFLQRLLGAGRGRDGENALLERQALQPPPVLPGLEPAAARRRPLAHPPQRLLQEQVAAKLLHAWMQNRHQTLFPLALNLQNLPLEQRGLLVQSMAASATMAGGGDIALDSLLPAIGGAAPEREVLAAALLAPPPLPPLLRALREAGLGAHAYTVALVALGPAAPQPGAAWLDYLAACFALPAGTTSDLRRRSGRRRLRPQAR